MRKKYWVIIAVTCAAIALIAGLWPSSAIPDPKTQSSEERMAFMASMDFARLPADAKRTYLDAAGVRPGGGYAERPDLNEEQRRQLRKNVRPLMWEQMQEQIAGYFELPPGQRTDYLDKMIDQRMERAGSRPSGTGGEVRGEGMRRGPSSERMKQRIENTPPEDRAHRMEFRKAMLERVVQRGLQDSFPGPGGR